MDKREERSRSKKAILGVVLAVVMVAMIGSTVAYCYGSKYNIIVPLGGPQIVLIGQDLEFQGNWSRIPPVVYRYVSGNLENTYTATLKEGKYYFYNVNWPTRGSFFVNSGAGFRNYDAVLYVEDPKMPLKLKVQDKEVSSIDQGTDLNVDVDGINLFYLDKVDLEIMGPDGQVSEKNGVSFTNITVGALKSFTGDGAINTSKWDEGSYTFQIKINHPDYACGLDAQSAKRELTIVKGTVQIKADTTEVPELAVVQLKVTGVAGHNITLKSDPLSKNAYFPAGLDDNPCDTTTNEFTDTIDDDGTRHYAVEFNDAGAYTIKVTDLDEKDSYDTVDITVTDKKVVFDVPDTVIIGQQFKIGGTVNIGDTVDIAVEGEIVENLNDAVIGENGEFRVGIDTSSPDAPSAFQIPGSVRLNAYIDRRGGPGNIGANEKSDGSAAILMIRGKLTAELSTYNVAQGGEFLITGTAPSAKSVDILIVAPKGFRASNIEGGMQMHYTSRQVSNTTDSFYKRINVGNDVDTGKYLVMVLSSGGDSVWGKNGHLELYNPNDPSNPETALGQYNITTGTQEEMLEIVEDLVFLSDDLLWIDIVHVEPPYMRLDSIVDVTIGEPLGVSGTTNREEGYTIVVTVKGPVELASVVVNVEKGRFNAVFETSNAVPGTYTVKADDGDGNTDTATANIPAALTPATMRLHKSWNFVSVPKKLAVGNSTFEHVFGLVNTSGHSIFFYDVKEGWTAVNSTEKVMPLRGYWVYSAETTLVHLTYDTYPLRTPPTRQLYKGWNAIGFSDTLPTDTNSVLTSIERSWAYLIGFDEAEQDYESAIINNDETGGVHDEDNLMQPMKGYWVYVTEDRELAGIGL
jgi:hypothetical protein